ncbi:uncharacterized protein LOC131614101 [Vicia villosa]|uniref:uncharacterized protein LOC131614101 n=1 Tax=Vicia villosa TaxID=3911 RepID=UPI00273BAAED|nr:uncharacterized protein LOC131614101 [Vicia villosa]
MTKVSDWWSNNSWSLKKNIQLSFPNLLKLIEGVSLPDEDIEDLYIWKSTKDGLLTLREVYITIAKPRPIAFWNSCVWDLDTPPAHSMIVWRLIHNKLQTDENLRARGHIWRWFANHLQMNLVINSIEDCWRVLDQHWFENIVPCWKSSVTIVAAHAKLVGNNSNRVSNSSMTSFSLLKKFGIQIKPKAQTATLEVLWSPPIVGWMKCNIDGVVLGNPRLAACGGLFRDHNANHVVSFCDFLGNESPEFAELFAPILALEEAKRRNINKLWLETDFLYVVNAFRNRALVPWKLCSRWLVCWNYSINIDFLVTHIYREANFCADSLAYVGLKCKSLRLFTFVHEDISIDYLLDKSDTPRIRLCHFGV